MAEENEGVKVPSFELKVSHEAKIRELLRNIVSSEIRLCSDGVKEFKKWLRGESGGDFLYQYVRSSSKLSELMEAWRIREKKPGLSYVLSLITVILDHPDGKYTLDDPGRVAISRVLDIFSKSIIEQKLDDLYKELNSKEAKRQKRALLLLAAIVRRGSVLASEVANVFDFKMPMFSKLAEYRRKGVLVKRKHSTRVAFIEFAMSFLEVGQPGLLRWVLQQREMFSGVLRGLGNDDDETVVYVLSTLRDRVLISESLIGPGLRSVLFGSVTLEQLANISGREDGSLAAEVAYRVLVMVCTDPANGLMPDLRRKISPLRGNPKRMIDLMKKLKPTEAKYHKQLLLSVVRGKPLLGSAYLDNFPFNLEDLSSSSWFSAVSFAANLVSSVCRGISWDFLHCHDNGPPSFHSSDVQMILKCVFPRLFTRAAISKGLQSKACKIRHGTLRFLLESMKLLDAFFKALMNNELSCLKQEVQNEVQNLIPDPQLMFNILNSLSNKHLKPISSLKRAAKSEIAPVIGKKKSKLNAEEDDDILIGGISSSVGEEFTPLEGKNRSEVSQPDKSEMDHDLVKITELWDFDQCSLTLATPVDAEVLFHCKLLEAFKICHCTLHYRVEASYDIFKIIPGNLVPLPCNLLQSLLSLLLEHIGWPSNSAFPCGILPPIYKYSQSFINLLIYSSNKDIKHQAYMLSQAALFSTGAFDSSPLDIRAWFLFLPGYEGEFVAEQSVRLLQKLSQPVVSFLCNAVSTVGNRLLKYLNDIKCHAFKVKGHREGTVAFSPLVACILEKCLQLLRSESGTFTVPEKTMVSLYVCGTLKYLLETQVECRSLSSFVHEFLSEQIGGRSSSATDPDDVACEWRPVMNLLSISEKILNQEGCTYLFADRKFLDASVSFTSVLDKVEKILRDGSDCKLEAVSMAFYSSLLCSKPNQLVQNLPSILAISENLYGLHNALLTPLLFIDQSVLVSIFRPWPEVSSGGLEMSLPRTKDIQLPKQPKHGTAAFESAKFASVAVGALLEHSPFHLLFPSIIIGGYRKHDSEIKELMLHKLSNMTIDQLILSLRLVLFWIHQVQSSYRGKPSDDLQQLSKTCYGILESIFDRLFSLKVGSAFSTDRSSTLVAQYFPIVAQTIFSHPIVAMSVLSPLHYCNNATEEILQDSLEGFLSILGHRVHEMDHQLFNLLSLTCDHLLTQSCGFYSLSKSNDYMNKIVKNFNQLLKKILLSFKKKFDLCVRTQDLVVMYPILYALLSLLPYVSPFELLELADWILCRVKHEGFVSCKTSGISPVCLGFFIAAGAFTVLDRSSQLPGTEGTHCNLLLGTKEKSFEVLFDGIYQKAVNYSIKFNLHSANMCLVEALKAVCRYECSQDLIFLSMGMLRVISATPIQIVSHCVNAPNGLKSKILLLLMKLSHLHMSIFGHLFLDIMDAPIQCLDDMEYLRLLPAALTYFSSAVSKFGKQHVQKFERIPSFYARILLEGFCNWRYFVSQTILELESGALLTSSSEELVNVCSNSLLGSAVLMLKNYFAIRVETMNERLMLFDSICSDDVASEGLLTFDVKKIKSYPVNQLLNLINSVVARISLCRALLFPDDSRTQLLTLGEHDGEDLSSGSHEVKVPALKFVDMLVRAWQLIVKKCPSASYSSGKDLNGYTLVKFLEVFILESIVDLAKKMSDVLVELDSLPFLEKIIRYSLLYRFGDSTTFELIRNTFCFLSKGSSPTDLLLQLLLGHSQLASCVLNVNNSSICQVTGLFSKPISSILRSLVISPSENNAMEELKESVRQLETIKLLRTLFCLSSRKHASFAEPGIGINIRELLFLLLSSYGGTLSEVDMEIYAFMREIELAEVINSGSIAELDYLWGSAATRVRKELDQEQSDSLNKGGNEMDAEQRRSRFRENLLIDPKLCIATVLYFPFERTSTEPIPTSESHERSAPKVNSENFKQLQRYDPVFILSFSVHCLSMEYLDPVEFSGLGLLAIALVSISCPDEGIRKLGYEVLGRFKDLLEKCRKKKDVVRLKLLLTYLQNGIHEPWQKIPSITAVFAAEASLILLDPSHDHYASISSLLTKSSRVNLKSLPFLDKFIWSSSVDFRADRQWVLRLLYVGINLEDDALIFLRSSILETLLSLYSSPLSDTESKELILQVVKKSAKLKRMAHHLVQSCGLISLLSSIVSSSFSLDGDNAPNCTKLLVTLLEVVKDAVSFRSNVEWLQMSGFEQLSDLSSHLFRILVSGSKFVAENATLVTSILETVMFSLRMSMKRKIFQPHLNFSFGCLYKLYQSIGSCNDVRYSACAEFGLKAILMSAPQASVLDEDYGELSQFLVWAVSTASLLDSGNISHSEHSHYYAVDLEEASDESLTSKLLRWLVASVILGKISSKLNNSSFLKARKSVGDYLSFMKQFDPQIGETKSMSQSEELLAAVIFHLQQLLGSKCRVVSSVVAALSLLLFAGTSCSTGSELDVVDDSPVSLLWSKMHSPPEVYPTWRWSYYQPWADLKSKTTDLEHLDELHACQGLLVTISELLLNRSSDSQSLSFKDFEDTGVFERERSILETK